MLYRVSASTSAQASDAAAASHTPVTPKKKANRITKIDVKINPLPMEILIADFGSSIDVKYPIRVMTMPRGRKAGEYILNALTLSAKRIGFSALSIYMLTIGFG